MKTRACEVKTVECGADAVDLLRLFGYAQEVPKNLVGVARGKIASEYCRDFWAD